MHARILFILLCLSSLSAIGQKARFRDISLKGEVALRFPVVILPDSLVAKKINDYLQINILGQTTASASGSKVFSGIKWSRHRSGLDELDYTVTMNNARLLCLEFDEEGVGAYPTPIREYYAFDAHTGDPIRPDDLFADAGLLELDKDLRHRRSVMIAEHVKELREDTSMYGANDSDKEADLEEVRSGLMSCDSGEEHARFSITDTGIVFHTEGCLRHALQAWDLDAAVCYGYSSVDAWLTDYGKELLLGRKGSRRQNDSSGPAGRPMHGMIGRYPIVMQLDTRVEGPGKEIDGSYYYTGKGIKIDISGYFRDGTLTLKESDDNGNETGIFSGIYERGVYSGIWTNAKTKKTFPFKINYAL